MTPSDPLLRERSNAEVLLWQSKLRVAFAIAVGGFGMALRIAGVLHGDWRALAIVIAVYLTIVSGLALVVEKRGRAGNVMLGLTVAADLAVIFTGTALVTPPEYYERTLLFSLCTIQFTEFYFGRRAAILAVAGATLGHIAIVWLAMSRGAPLLWAEEATGLATFVLAALVFIIVHGNFRLRLARIAAIFDRAQEGDFTHEYDVDADGRPDAITMVGRAYNRMRTQLASIVISDPLSRCLNRRGFELELAREISRASRTGGSLALLAMDADMFKEINDTFGHLAGDAAIREIGTRLRAVARLGDVVARVGGEEFVLLAPATDEDGALYLANRIAESFRAHPFTVGSRQIPLTLSIGVVAEPAITADSAEDLRARADEALYAAKRSGRDCVVLWTHGLPPVARGTLGPSVLVSGAWPSPQDRGDVTQGR